MTNDRDDIFPEDALGKEMMLRSLGWVRIAKGWKGWRHPASPGLFDLATACEVTIRGLNRYNDNTSPTWTPSEADVKWQRRLIERFTVDPSVWRGTDFEWTLYLAKKLAVLTKKKEGSTTAGRVAQVFELLGWQVYDKLSPPVNPESRDAIAVLFGLVDTIEATGGVIECRDGTLGCVGDPEWSDLANVYLEACKLLNREPKIEIEV